LKQENEDLKAELATVKELSANIQPRKDSVNGPTDTTTTAKVETELSIEKNLLRQEFQALQVYKRLHVHFELHDHKINIGS
jgi:hypothetical protein